MTVDQYPLPEDEESLLSQVAQLDRARDDFFAQANIFIKLPTHRNKLNFVESASEHARHMGTSVEHILEDASMDTVEKAQLISMLLCDEDMRRVNFINGILGKDYLQIARNDREELATIIKELVEQPDETDEPAETQILCMFASCVTIDLNETFELVGSSRKSRILGFAPKVGSSALRTLEIGIGVTLGVWLGNKIKGS